MNLDVSGAVTAATFTITNPQLTNLRLSNLSSSAVRSDVSVDLGSLGTVVRSVDLSGHDAATATKGVALVLNNAAVFGASVIGSADNDLINGSGQGDTISSGGGADVMYADNGGTKSINTIALVTAANGIYSAKILGITTSATLAAGTAIDDVTKTAASLVAQINANSSLNKLVIATSAVGVVTVRYLVDGVNVVTTTTTGANNTAAVTSNGTGDSIVGVAGNIAKDIIDAGTGNDFIVGNGGADIITTGAGDDTAVLYARTQSNTSTASSWTTVTDFRASGTDKLHLSAVVNGTAAITTTTIASAASLSAFITNSFSGDGGTNSIIQAAYFGGDTYIAVDNSNGAFSETADMVIKLTGTSITALTTDMFIVA